MVVCATVDNANGTFGSSLALDIGVTMLSTLVVELVPRVLAIGTYVDIGVVLFDVAEQITQGTPRVGCLWASLLGAGHVADDQVSLVARGVIDSANFHSVQVAGESSLIRPSHSFFCAE